MCLSPITIKNKGVTELVHPFISVPCGVCIDCLRAHVNKWTFRLMEEQKISETAFFITLTYNDENVPISKNGLLTLRKSDFQKFIKRLRKNYPESDLKYYAVGEYGSETQRPHYHAVIYNIPQYLVTKSTRLESEWKHGQIDIRKNNVRTIKYTLKYLMKTTKDKRKNDPTDDREPEKPMMSKKMGLSYLTRAKIRYHIENKDFMITEPGGSKVAMPRYFKDKLFTRADKAVFHEKVAKEIDKTLETKFINLEHYTQWKKDKIRKAEKASLTSRKQL